MTKKKDEQLALVPTSVDDLERMSKLMAASQLAPQALRTKPHDVAVIIMTGMELGIPPMTALRTIHVVQGKAVLSADLIAAKALAHPDCISFGMVESTATKAVYECQRRGNEVRSYEYTMDDAKAANLSGKDNWRKHPKAMLRARCKSILAREVFPDALAGVYSHDEAQDIEATFVPAAEVEVLPGEVIESENPFAHLNADSLLSIITHETSLANLKDERLKDAIRGIPDKDDMKTLVDAWCAQRDELEAS